MQNEKTSTHQYERMVNLLSEYPDIAQNFTKRTPESVAVFWEDLTNQLNLLGPRQWDVGGWKKVWNDYKSFTPLEDAVIALTNIGSSVSGIGAKSFGAGNISHQVPLAESSRSITAEADEDENQASTSQHQNAANTSRRRRPMSSLQLLTNQVKNQENFCKETSKTLKRLYRSIDDVCKVEKEKLKEMQTHNIEMRRIAVQNLELKKRKLELEIQKTNMMME